MITLSKAVTKSKNDGTENKNFNFYQYVWIFVVSCLLGYAIETLWCFIRHGYIESRKSLVLGHLSLAYGMGAVLLTLILSRFQKTKSWKIFLISFFAGTVTEYICSLGQEICFGTVAWDYSNVPLNINGRVCLLYSSFWGFLGIFWAKIVIPQMTKIFDKVHIPFNKILVWTFIVYFCFNCFLSATAAARMNMRKDGKPANNKYEMWLDETYTDEKMAKIYANSRPVEK